MEVSTVLVTGVLACHGSTHVPSVAGLVLRSATVSGTACYFNTNVAVAASVVDALVWSESLNVLVLADRVNSTGFLAFANGASDWIISSWIAALYWPTC
jgi:hypothetical protein